MAARLRNQRKNLSAARQLAIAASFTLRITTALSVHLNELEPDYLPEIILKQFLIVRIMSRAKLPFILLRLALLRRIP
jgi:hypothetical protein